MPVSPLLQVTAMAPWDTSLPQQSHSEGGYEPWSTSFDPLQKKIFLRGIEKLVRWFILSLFPVIEIARLHSYSAGIRGNVQRSNSARADTTA